VAGCATPIGFAGHAPTSATANSELTFHPDHSMGADQHALRQNGIKDRVEGFGSLLSKH
jgi:hypothetical protein